MNSIIKQLLSPPFHYTKRLYRWGVVLRQVRGKNFGDQWSLVQSALAAPILSFRNLSKWQDPILLRDADVIVSGVGHFSIRRKCDDLWHVLPYREQAIVAQLGKLLRPGDRFVDAGANIGFYSVLASRLVKEDGRVIAIEMMPDTASRLEHNIGLNDAQNVQLERYALSDVSGVELSVRINPEKYGQASIAEQFAEKEGESAQVETKTLDEICHDQERIRLMKVDLEGAEIGAIRGGKNVLSRTDYVVFESRRYDDQVDEVAAAMIENGFDLFRIDGNNQLAKNRSISDG